ncbi:MAG TPA: ATP synthase F1 subunit gamma [Phaeodactylibacter sp.]|nr:ATP synthase F1 subunit gamma [Phaeodactylibacter sp.]
MGANLKEVRESIKSVKSTQQITKAMKMVSAAKLRRAQMAITDLRPYADRLNKMLVNILSNMEGDGANVFGTERDIKKALVVVVTSSRGLCGAFNSNIIKSAVATIEERLADLKDSSNLTIMTIGKKGNDYFKKRYLNCQKITDYVDLFGDLSFDNVSKASQLIMDEFVAGNYDVVFVSYGRFKNAAVQFPETERFLPVRSLESDVVEEVKPKSRADYIFEPNKEKLLEELIPSILQTTFQKYLLDTNASEHGARMTAMDKATENAAEMLKDLKISYNKARQEAITKELSEIVGGAAALEG